MITERGEEVEESLWKKTITGDRSDNTMATNERIIGHVKNIPSLEYIQTRRKGGHNNFIHTIQQQLLAHHHHRVQNSFSFRTCCRTTFR